MTDFYSFFHDTYMECETFFVADIDEPRSVECYSLSDDAEKLLQNICSNFLLEVNLFGAVDQSDYRSLAWDFYHAAQKTGASGFNYTHRAIAEKYSFYTWLDDSCGLLGVSHN
jgi:hypothetical protein